LFLLNWQASLRVFDTTLGRVLSIGIEHIDDIKADLEQALAAAK